jgi:ABC-type transporter Mla subunit MlaD
MTLRGILSGTASWLRAHRFEDNSQCGPALDEDGLLAMDFEADGDVHSARSAGAASAPVVVSTITSLERREPVDRLQEGLDRLVGELEQINEHLSEQLSQHEELMGRVRQLPQLLESLPSAVENQKRLTSQLLEQLRSTAAKDRQFSEVVQQIPVAAGRQTDALMDINHQLVAAAEVDVQMADSFNKFRITLDRLNQSTVSNTEGIVQMSRTFAASDRYLKFVVTKLNKRYAWTLAATLGVCAAVVTSLIGVIFYLAR